MMNNTCTENYDAFISYRHDTGFYMAQVIYDKLTYNGYSVFMDQRVRNGDFEQQIKDAVQNSRNFIMILFPTDLDQSDDENDWLRKEAAWAVNNPAINLIPVFCDDFNTEQIKAVLPDCLKKLLACEGVTIHKDKIFGEDLDRLQDKFLQNANPVRPLINTVEFFKHSLHSQSLLSPKSIDMAFHGGTPWLMPGEKKEILSEILRRQIPVRILINTPEAAQSIAQYMHDDEAVYVSFEELQEKWAKRASSYPELMEVRACPIPLLRVYHNIKFEETEFGNIHDRIHVKYYAYQSLNAHKNFEHEISTFSKYYEIYQKEFEFLWSKSVRLQAEK